MIAFDSEVHLFVVTVGSVAFEIVAADAHSQPEAGAIEATREVVFLDVGVGVVVAVVVVVVVVGIVLATSDWSMLCAYNQ